MPAPNLAVSDYAVRFPEADGSPPKFLSLGYLRRNHDAVSYAAILKSVLRRKGLG